MHFPHVSDDNPFKVLSSGVESDVLCILGRSPLEHSASNIADLTQRSRSQVYMVLQRLVEQQLVLKRVLEHWSGYRLVTRSTAGA
jgi:DNA-binding IclR family transcriptional regulator